MSDYFSRWFGKSSPPARLSNDEAIAIARRAAAGDPLGDALALTKLERRSTGAVWIVSSATVGRMLEITVDDATGQVLDKRHVGMR